jgi:hypothetical protein
MKSRRLMLLAVFASLVSAVTIAASATASSPSRAVPYFDLRKFDARFTKLINEAIRDTLHIDINPQARQKQKREESKNNSKNKKDLWGQKCYKDWLSVNIQKVEQTARKEDLCDLKPAENQWLRDQVNRWLDRVAWGEVTDDQLAKIKSRGPDYRDFFSETIPPDATQGAK